MSGSQLDFLTKSFASTTNATKWDFCQSRPRAFHHSCTIHFKGFSISRRHGNFALGCDDYAGMFLANSKVSHEPETDELFPRTALGVAVLKVPGGS